MGLILFMSYYSHQRYRFHRPRQSHGFLHGKHVNSFLFYQPVGELRGEGLNQRCLGRGGGAWGDRMQKLVDTTHYLPTFLSAPALLRLPDQGSLKLGWGGESPDQALDE